MSNYQICDMKLEHIEQVCDIEEKSFKTPWSKDAFVSELVRNKCAVYRVLIFDGRIAAYAGFWHVVDEGHITNVAVHPDFRGMGFGDAMVRELIVCARKLGITALTLEVRTGNTNAINLYRKHGFCDIALRKGYYADTGEDAIIMWKKDL